MTTRDIKVIKLIDGEEIVAELIESHMDRTVAESAISVRSPMLLDARQIDSKLSIVMVDYVPFTSNKDITICLDKIITVSAASPELIEYYELMLEQLKYSAEAINEAIGKTVKSLRKILDVYKGMDTADNLLDKVTKTYNKSTSSGTKH